MGGGFVENQRRHWLAESGDKTTSRQGRRNIGCANRQSANNGKRVRIHGGGGNMVKSVTRVTVSRQRLRRPPASQTAHGVSSRHFFRIHP